ncbi:biopolymer transporter ExbD [Pacificibacter sp. AS14]|uniref:ExbD/TolR family protein n=1 Tax=Pacificibacter sp. AS14 TaxID=3135785 RepID=UPI00316DD527
MDFSQPRKARKPSLTPMIDVVFLLLVFFMLASRFGADMHIPMQISGAGTGYSGPPRLVDVRPETLSVNGISVSEDGMITALKGLIDTADDIVIIRPREAASLQRVVTVMGLLGDAGFSRVVLVK